MGVTAGVSTTWAGCALMSARSVGCACEREAAKASLHAAAMWHGTAGHRPARRGSTGRHEGTTAGPAKEAGPATVSLLL